MRMLDMLEKEVQIKLFNNSNLPEIVTAVADSIPSNTIPYRMKLAIAVSEIALFVSQFRINIKHWNDSIIPINTITFCIAKSGASKDSSLKAARKCFMTGYSIIEQERKQHAIDKAIQLATENGCDIPNRFAGYKDFLVPVNPLFIATSTVEGFIQHLNDLADSIIGAGYLQSSELGAELSSNSNLVDNIRVISELYDEGNKLVKITKSREIQAKEVKHLPVSAMFMGSEDNILFDETIKRKFKTEFTTKLARRSNVIFVSENIEQHEYINPIALMNAIRVQEDKAIQVRLEIQEYITEYTKILQNSSVKEISVSDEVRDLFNLYKAYNENLSETIDILLPMTKLTRQHLQWKALKIAGAFALIQQEYVINSSNYRSAVNFVEGITDDIKNLEMELTKEMYEFFPSYVRQLAQKQNTYSISFHELRKKGFIKAGNLQNNVKEFVTLVNSCDKEGTYIIEKDNVVFNQLIKTNVCKVSFQECYGTKAERARHCADGYILEEVEFEELAGLLNMDAVYSSFWFENGIRGKDNIISGCKWIVLDVDTSEITDEEAHILLSELNHHIARTSNPDNPEKYRILLELDSEVNIPNMQWKQFIGFIANDLGITCDSLPKAQIFFSYKNRNVLSIINGQKLNTKFYLSKLTEIKPKETLTKGAKIELLADPLTTFSPVFDAEDGQGRQKIVWALKYARELGADREYCHNLLDKIQDYWVKPMPDKDIESFHNQLDRWDF